MGEILCERRRELEESTSVPMMHRMEPPPLAHTHISDPTLTSHGQHHQYDPTRHAAHNSMANHCPNYCISTAASVLINSNDPVESYSSKVHKEQLTSIQQLNHDSTPTRMGMSNLISSNTHYLLTVMIM